MSVPHVRQPGVASQERFVLKICGITREVDAMHAAECGATAVGFIFWPRSPRYVSPESAAGIIRRLPGHVVPVGVFVDEPVERLHDIVSRSGVRVAQLHGAEGPAYASSVTVPVLRSVTLQGVIDESEPWPAGTTLLLDTFDPVRKGGTGEMVDWVRAADVARRTPIVLAGGLTPDNVAEAIATVRPAGVDVSSGVEASPGVKDLDKVERFLANARRALASAMSKVVSE